MILQAQLLRVRQGRNGQSSAYHYVVQNTLVVESLHADIDDAVDFPFVIQWTIDSQKIGFLSKENSENMLAWLEN